MRTSTDNTIATGKPMVLKLTLREAVIEAITELKSTLSSIKVSDIMEEIKSAINVGEFVVSDYQSYNVVENVIKTIIYDLIKNGTLKDIGIKQFNDNNGNILLQFDGENDNLKEIVEAEFVSPVQEKINNYLKYCKNNNRDFPTLKQIQGALKINGINCQDLFEIVKSMGKKINVGTEGCYSTYTVQS